MSYVTKKNKSVLLLSNIHSDRVIPHNSKKSKPTIVLDYNSHKSGVEKFDQMLAEYRMNRANRRWPVVLFFDLIDFVCQAAWVIFCLKFPHNAIMKSKDRREFLYILGKELLSPLIQSPRSSCRYKFYTQSLKECVDSQTSSLPLGPTNVDAVPSTSAITTTDTIESIPCLIRSVKRRCFYCPRSQDRKVSSKCYYCDVCVCNQHSTQYFVCKRCSEDSTI